MHVPGALSFVGGDEVIVLPSRITGEIRGWEVNGSRLETSVLYQVRLDKAPLQDEIVVEARDLEPRLRMLASETA